MRLHGSLKAKKKTGNCYQLHGEDSDFKGKAATAEMGSTVHGWDEDRE